MGGKPLRFFPALGLDNAHRFLVHEQYIVRRADIGLVFAHGLTLAGVQVDFLAGLNDPARLRAVHQCCRGLFVRDSGFQSLLKHLRHLEGRR